MKNRSSPWLGDRRGIAAVEFALIVPVLLLMLGGLADYGLLMVGKGQLANGLAQGAQYALLQAPSLLQDPSTAVQTVQTVVQRAAARSGVTGTVTVNVTGPACYCVSSTYPATRTSAPNPLSDNVCAGTCPSPAAAPGVFVPSPAAAPGVFVIISASYAYQPLMPLYSKITNTTVSDTVTVRLK